MKLWRRRSRLPSPADDAASVARLMEQWLDDTARSGLRAGEAADLRDRWSRLGRLAPGEAQRFADWARERARVTLAEMTGGDGPLVRPASPEEFERARIEALAMAETHQAMERWLRAEGYA
ncbi:hypothetical protein [Peterkaempfera bronchialis]|uniref:Uncharacterized protein n=1 Tax=Peterkaempfera bronchialis TaxID=2126346 RepID=A0A345T3U6_9ACTN|nr:hypothetical protein [Peterkaempfera bronchialis]AXI80651.1 hypothetical protein C7M71_027945 [Peterkaempfera bronchialis]